MREMRGGPGEGPFEKLTLYIKPENGRKRAMPQPPDPPPEPGARKRLRWKDGEQRALTGAGSDAGVDFCCSVKATVRWFVGFAVAVQIAVVVALSVLGDYNMTAFTFWCAAPLCYAED